MNNAAKFLSRRLESARADIAEFAAKLVADPVHAMGWSDDAFKAAAKVKVFSLVEASLANGASPEDIAKWGVNAAIRAARDPARSSSPTSNIMEQEVAAAWAEIAELFAAE